MWWNLIAFNLMWLGLVLLGNNFVPIALLWLIGHIVREKQSLQELQLIIQVTLIGITVDNVWVQLSVFDFGQRAFIPLWLVVLWACFAATLGHSLKFLTKSIYFQVIAGAVFAPLSYFAGERLSAVGFGYSHYFTFLLLSVSWALLMVIFFKLLNASQGRTTA